MLLHCMNSACNTADTPWAQGLLGSMAASCRALAAQVLHTGIALDTHAPSMRAGHGTHLVCMPANRCTHTVCSDTSAWPTVTHCCRVGSATTLLVLGATPATAALMGVLCVLLSTGRTSTCQSNKGSHKLHNLLYCTLEHTTFWQPLAPPNTPSSQAPQPQAASLSRQR
jgi:hypothetical protein